MRSLIASALFLASFASMAGDDYVETRELSVAADGIQSLDIRAGAGSLAVVGVAGDDAIEVTARIIVPGADSDEGQEIVAEEARLSLDREGETARLRSRFERMFWGFGSDGRIDLEVRVPQGMALVIDDSSGEVDVERVGADVSITDNSGSIDVDGVAALKITDGSGSINAANAAGDVNIKDGSGSITHTGVVGHVDIPK